MYYTVIKHSGHLRTLEKCRKHSPAARVVYISLVFSNACRVLSQCNTRLRLLYLLSMGHAALRINELCTEPIIVWIAIVLPTGMWRPFNIHFQSARIQQPLNTDNCVLTEEMDYLALPNAVINECGSLGFSSQGTHTHCATQLPRACRPANEHN